VPVQELDAVTAFVAEDEDVSGQRIGLELLADLFGQTVEAAPQVHRLTAQPDAHRGWEAQHGSAPSSSRASSCRSVAGAKPGVTRRRRPPASTISMLPTGTASSGRT